MENVEVNLLLILSAEYVKSVNNVVVYSTLEGFIEYFFFQTNEEAAQAEVILKECFANSYLPLVS